MAKECTYAYVTRDTADHCISASYAVRIFFYSPWVFELSGEVVGRDELHDVLLVVVRVLVHARENVVRTAHF